MSALQADFSIRKLSAKRENEGKANVKLVAIVRDMWRVP